MGGKLRLQKDGGIVSEKARETDNITGFSRIKSEKKKDIAPRPKVFEAYDQKRTANEGEGARGRRAMTQKIGPTR